MNSKPEGPPHFCGLPMSLNPHPDAGIPGRFLEVGTVRECIPCLVASRHGWAKTAGELQKRNAELTKALQNLKAAWAASPESITAPEYQEARDVLDKKAWIPAIDAVMSAEWMPPEPIYQTEWLGDGGGRWVDIPAEQYEHFSTLPHYNVRTVYAAAPQTHPIESNP